MWHCSITEDIWLADYAFNQNANPGFKFNIGEASTSYWGR